MGTCRDLSCGGTNCPPTFPNGDCRIRVSAQAGTPYNPNGQKKCDYRSRETGELWGSTTHLRRHHAEIERRKSFGAKEDEQNGGKHDNEGGKKGGKPGKKGVREVGVDQPEADSSSQEKAWLDAGLGDSQNDDWRWRG